MDSADLTVLVAEDEALLRFYAVDIFADRGIRTLEATNSVEALAIIQNHPEINVLLTDINMLGEMDGLDLAHEVHRRWPAIQLIIASGRMTPAIGEMPVGSNFVSKPFKPDAILRLIGLGE